MKIGNIKAFAVDIDGVLVKDTFSLVIRILAKKYNKPYTFELEYHTFSKNQKIAARFLKNYLESERTVEELIDEYFDERSRFIKAHPEKSGLINGVGKFLDFLKSYELPMICYGGLNKDYFNRILGKYTSYFEEYICTNDFRPGIYEIVENYFKMDYENVLFFDDVCSFGVEARKSGCPFIGVVIEETFQKRCMEEHKIEYIVDSLEKIDEDLIKKLSVTL